MSVFPQLALKPEVREHLHSVYTHNEVVCEVGKEEAARAFEALLSCLSHPPMFTCVRVSTHLHTLTDIQHKLQQHVTQISCRDGSASPAVIHTHPHLPDVLLVPVSGPRCVDLQGSEVIVGAQCGNAVLRGAHVFTPGVLGTPKFMKAGDVVSVFSDIDGKCTRGAKEFQGKKVFLGNGVSEVHRSDVFCSEGPARGVAIRMTEPLYQSPSFDGVLTEDVFLQNLPSVVVGHVLGPRPGERILDMCAAPGGKTTHIASLMNNQGAVVALEKIKSKMEKIIQNAKTLKLECIRAYCCDSTQAVISHPTHHYNAGRAFQPDGFSEVSLSIHQSQIGKIASVKMTILLHGLCCITPVSSSSFTMKNFLLKNGQWIKYSVCGVSFLYTDESVTLIIGMFLTFTEDKHEISVGSNRLLNLKIPPIRIVFMQNSNVHLSGVNLALTPSYCMSINKTKGRYILSIKKGLENAKNVCSE
ncbi:putative methyltransferase NSUN6 [Triplophysa tibetana]|uniref:Putative methyltransferase NSUN6 n=1 Tax=Triplophysa tibetana TaxID=1572043 RepID=A0A5A9PPY9_9TELE|nr:putative methyltransferase NSUN6 [Triplophysa tibetana]